MQPMTQIFGVELENLPEDLVQPFGLFLKQYAKDNQNRNYQKMIIWYGNVLGIQGLWNRYYAGRYYDVVINKNSQ